MIKIDVRINYQVAFELERPKDVARLLLLLIEIEDEREEREERLRSAVDRLSKVVEPPIDDTFGMGPVEPPAPAEPRL